MKKYIKFLLILVPVICGIFIFNSCKQADTTVTPIVTSSNWVKMYGGGLSDIITSVQTVPSGGFIAAGYTVSFGQGLNEVYIVRINSDGGVQWSKSYGTTQNDETAQIQALSDGTFIVAGRTSSASLPNYDVFAMKLDANGNLLWNKIYKWSGNVVTSGVQQTSDNGFVIAGTSGFSPGQTDAFVLKIDGSGAAQWLKSYGGPFNDICTSIKKTSDNGFIICGSSFSGGFPDGDGFLEKLYADGSMAWTNFYGGNDGYDQFNDVYQNTDGGYIAAGVTYAFGLTTGDIMILRTDAGGVVAPGWPRTLGDSSLGLDMANSVVQADDGSFTLTGYRTNGSSTDIVVSNYFGDATYNWTKVYGGSGSDKGITIVKNSGKYVLGGISSSANNDMYILNLKPDGTCCSGTKPFTPVGGSPTVTNVPGSFSSASFTPTVIDGHFTAANAATIVTAQCSE